MLGENQFTTTRMNRMAANMEVNLGIIQIKN